MKRRVSDYTKIGAVCSDCARRAGFTLSGSNKAMHPKWGEPVNCRRAYLVVMLGEVVARGTYAEVRESVR